METVAVFLLSFCTLRIFWDAPASLLQKFSIRGLLLWPLCFAFGFFVDEVFFSLAFFFSFAPLLLWVRSVWADDDSDEGPEDPWDYVPHNPLSGKRKKSRDPLRG